MIDIIRCQYTGGNTIVMRSGKRFRVLKDEVTLFNQLAQPHKNKYNFVNVTYDEVNDRRHFESDAEMRAVIRAFCDMATMAKDTEGPFAACSADNFEILRKYCMGEEVPTNE